MLGLSCATYIKLHPAWKEDIYWFFNKISSINDKYKGYEDCITKLEKNSGKLNPKD